MRERRAKIGMLRAQSTGSERRIDLAILPTERSGLEGSRLAPRRAQATAAVAQQTVMRQKREAEKERERERRRGKRERGRR